MTPRKFRNARKRLGMTQAALAEALHLAASGKQHISNIERGSRKPSALLLALFQTVIEKDDRTP